MSFTIKRGPRAADNFVIVSNALAREHRLSFKARGLALWLLSHRDDFELTQARIAELNGVGVDAVRTGVEELEKLGYLRRERARDEKTGQLSGSVYYLTDTPISAGEAQGGISQDRPTQHRPIQAHKKTTSLEDHLEEGSAADATGDQELPLDLPRPKPEGSRDGDKPPTVNQLAVKIAQRAYDRSRGMVNMGQVISLAKTCLQASYPPERIDAAIRYLQQQNWKITTDNLRQQLEGGPKPPAPATTRPTTGPNEFRTASGHIMEYR